jgi:hypothetical protein
LGDTAGYTIQTQTTALALLPQQVVCSDFQSTELEASFFGNTWLYVPTGQNAGQCRRVQYQGLDPTTGTITLESALPNLTQGATPIEVYGKLPPVRREGRLGLQDIVNRVLAECWTIKRLPLVGVQDQKLYPLGASFPWLQAEDQLVEVYYRAANANPNDDDMLMYNWRWIPAADNPSVEVSQPLNSGDTLLLEAYVPMNWWIGTGSPPVWGLQTTPGLQNETDLGLISILGMQLVGRPWVLEELGKWGLAEDQANFEAQRVKARAAANQWKRLTLQHPQVRKNHWPAVMTVRTRDNYGQGYTILTPG